MAGVPSPEGPPDATTIEWTRPNPFNWSTAIGFSLARAGRVRVEVCNVLGQRVSRLVDDVLPAGRHDARWDGRGPGGRAMASGIY